MPRFPARFWGLFGTDLVVRTAYQVGKTPMLPLFAAALGAGELLVGLIVAVSTGTGMVLKPLFGVLSDRIGRRVWLLAGVAVFSGTPFLYAWISTPDELFALRLLHGLATAIFGPVTLAYVLEMDVSGRATRLAWFGMAREGGYLLAPALAGWLLTVRSPEEIFTLIGLVSCLALLPLAAVTENAHGALRRPRRPGIWQQFREAGTNVLTRAELWAAGCVEMAVYVATYALKAFLPIFIVSEAGLGVLTAGIFFTVQEAAHLAARPGGGWLAERLGIRPAVSIGLVSLAVGIALVPLVTSPEALFAIALLIGTAQAAVFPATVALVGRAVDADHLGAGMGVFGTLRNVGKIAGPAMIGGLLEVTTFAAVFDGLAIGLVVAGIVVMYGTRLKGLARRPVRGM